MEELRRLKQETGMTNQQIADASGVPLGTVNRVLAGRAKNPAYSTVSAMRDAMSAEEQPPPVPDCDRRSCPHDMPTSADFKRLSDNFMELNSRAEASFDKERLSFERQLKRAHQRLIVSEALIALFFLASLALYIYNVMNPTRGWFVQPTSTIYMSTASPDA